MNEKRKIDHRRVFRDLALGWLIIWVFLLIEVVPQTGFHLREVLLLGLGMPLFGSIWFLFGAAIDYYDGTDI